PPSPTGSLAGASTSAARASDSAFSRRWHSPTVSGERTHGCSNTSTTGKTPQSPGGIDMPAANLPLASYLQSEVLEYFLLRRAEREASAVTPTQQEAIRSYYDAAQKRLEAAEDLRAADQLPLALPLYREASVLLSAAVLARNEEVRDLGTVPLEDLLDRLGHQ